MGARGHPPRGAGWTPGSAHRARSTSEEFERAIQARFKQPLLPRVVRDDDEVALHARQLNLELDFYHHLFQ